MSDIKSMEQAITKLFEKYDRDGNGFLDVNEAREFTEFVMVEMGMIEKGKSMDDKVLLVVFKSMDSNNSGTIQEKEFKEFLNKCIEKQAK